MNVRRGQLSFYKYVFKNSSQLDMVHYSQTVQLKPIILLKVEVDHTDQPLYVNRSIKTQFRNIK